MIRHILCSLFIFFGSICYSQDTNSSNNDITIEEADVPFAVIDEVPVYPGCEGTNNEVLKKCMSDKIGLFVSENFNMKLLESLPLKPGKYRTAVQFKIDKEGSVVDVRARNTNGSIEVEEEAIRVVSLIPKMKPGIQRGKTVGVLYALPIIFEVEPPAKINRRKQQKKSKN
jgi:protein TonB